MPSVFPGPSKVARILTLAQKRGFRDLWSYEFVSKTESRVDNQSRLPIGGAIPAPDCLDLCSQKFLCRP